MKEGGGGGGGGRTMLYMCDYMLLFPASLSSLLTHSLP